MKNGETPGDEDKGFSRPWEKPQDEAEVFTLPGIEDESEASPAADDGPEHPGDEDGDPVEGTQAQVEAGTDDLDLSDWEKMAAQTSGLDEYTSSDYSATTTQEYRGLAEEVSRSAEAEWEQQAVAASLPGVDSGLVGFEDVTGTALKSEEQHEAAEQAAASDVTMRVASALIIFGMFLGSLLLGGWWFAGFIAIVMVVGAGEFYATIRSHGFRPLALFGLLGVVFMAVGAHTSGPAAIGGWAAGFTVATILFYSLSVRRDALESTALTVAGMLWMGLLSFAILIEHGPRPVATILFLVVVVAFNDIGAFFVGRGFGRRRMAPTLSPNKTVEGLIGGMISSVAVASLFVLFPSWEHVGFGRAVAIALIVSVLAPVGDLLESTVKRSLGVKDMGSVLPGHGGILDRVDGFILAVPAVYVLLRGFGLL
jgi:phosphatidate cytidylyltransferase